MFDTAYPEGGGSRIHGTHRDSPAGHPGAAFTLRGEYVDQIRKPAFLAAPDPASELPRPGQSPLRLGSHRSPIQRSSPRRVARTPDPIQHFSISLDSLTRSPGSPVSPLTPQQRKELLMHARRLEHLALTGKMPDKMEFTSFEGHQESYHDGTTLDTTVMVPTADTDGSKKSRRSKRKKKVPSYMRHTQSSRNILSTPPAKGKRGVRSVDGEDSAAEQPPSSVVRSKARSTRSVQSVTESVMGSTIARRLATESNKIYKEVGSPAFFQLRHTAHSLGDMPTLAWESSLRGGTPVKKREERIEYAPVATPVLPSNSRREMKGFEYSDI